MSKVKSVKLYKFDYVLKDFNSDVFELKGGIYSHVAYNKEGKTISEIKYDASGEIEQHYTYEYNDKGLRTAEKSYDENGELIDDMEYVLDENGKVLYGYKNYLDGSRDTITYRYDDMNNMVEREVMNDEGEVEAKDKYAYEGNNEVLHESLDEENEPVYRKETLYNVHGDVVEEKAWSIETGTTTRILNTYNDDKQLMKVTSYDEEGDILFTVNYERDDDGQIVSVREESDGGLSLTHIEYDEKGNAVVHEERNADDEINSRIERKYDADGRVTESEAILDRHGRGMNQHYVLKYEYEYY